MPRPREDPCMWSQRSDAPRTADTTADEYIDDRDLEAGRRPRYPPPSYQDRERDRERDRDRDRPRRRREDDYASAPPKGKIASFLSVAKDFQKEYKKASGAHGSPDRRPRRQYSDDDDESPPPRRERRRSPRPAPRPRRHYDSDDESPPPPRRERERDRPRRRDPDPREYDDMFDKYGRDRRYAERPDKYGGYYSDNRHDRPPRAYPDDRYRDRSRDGYRDRKRPGPPTRKESKWQKEAADMFKQYALPVIKAEGGKYISKQLGGFMAAQAGKR
jgi:hypothetical protein